MTDLTAINQFRLLEARSFLEQFHLFDSSLTEERKAGVLKLYKTASTTITKTISGFSDSNWFDVLAHAPQHMFRVLFSAAATLLKILNSSYSSYVDYDTGKLLFDSAKFAIRRLSVQENDLTSRGAQLLHFFWDLSQASQTRDEPPDLIIKSRLGASIMYDCILRWKARTRANATGKIETASAPDSVNAGAKVARPPSLENLRLQTGSAPHSALFPIYDQQMPSISDDWSSLPSVDWLWDFELPYDPMVAAV